MHQIDLSGIHHLCVCGVCVLGPLMRYVRQLMATWLPFELMANSN